MKLFDAFQVGSEKSLRHNGLVVDSILVLQLLFSDKYIDVTQKLVEPPTEIELAAWQSIFVKTYRSLGNGGVGLRGCVSGFEHNDSAVVIAVSQSVLGHLLFSREFAAMRRMELSDLSKQQLEFFRKVFYFYYGSKHGSLSEISSIGKQKIFEVFILLLMHPDVAMYQGLLTESKDRMLKQKQGLQVAASVNKSKTTDGGDGRRVDLSSGRNNSVNDVKGVSANIPVFVDKVLSPKVGRLYR